MDTSETYIKMCDCEEIQEQYKHPKDEGEFIRRKDCFAPKETLRLLWLPRQDQIQEMMDDKFTLDGLLGCFNSFWNPNCELYKPYPKIPKGYGVFHLFKSCEQLWLAFYMHEKHNKVWDGEKWRGK